MGENTLKKTKFFIEIGGVRIPVPGRIEDVCFERDESGEQYGKFAKKEIKGDM